jgi:hypothetical protein
LSKATEILENLPSSFEAFSNGSLNFLDVKVRRVSGVKKGARRRENLKQKEFGHL